MRRSSAALALGLLLLHAAAAPAGAEQGESVGQEVRDGGLVDHGYLFELRPPGPGWRVLPETEAQGLSGDAVAALLAPGDDWFAVVIVERTSGVQATELAALTAEFAALEAKEVDRIEEIEFKGHAAARYGMRGRREGLELAYSVLVIVHRDYGYQLVVGTTDPQAATPERFGSVHRCFDLVDGDAVPGRASSRGVDEAQGLGWRVAGGTFQSAISGLVVPPAEGWRLLVGGELDAINAEAEVGLNYPTEDVYLVLLSERVAGAEPDAYAATLRRQHSEALGAPAIEATFAAELAGREVRLELRRTRLHTDFDFLHGVVFHDGIAIQVVAWWLSAQREAALPLARQSLRAIGLLGRDERGALAEELAAGPDLQSAVGPGYALRGGLYRDYAFGFTWRRPAGLWRIHAGFQARAQNPDARLVLVAPSLGLHAVVIVERAAGVDPDALHHVAVANTGGEPGPRAGGERIRGDGVEWLTSWVDVAGAPALRYLVATAVAGDRLFQLLVWGLPGNVADAGEAARDAVAALSVPERGPAPITRTEEALSDDRFGFVLRRPTPEATLEIATPAGFDGVGTVVGWRVDDHHSITVTAVEPPAGGAHDEGALERIVVEGTQADVRAALGVTAEEVGSRTLHGHEARRLQARNPRGLGAMDGFVFRRGRTFFVVLAFSAEGDAPSVDALVSCFELDAGAR